MRFFKIILPVIALVLLLLLSAAGCKGGGDDTEDSQVYNTVIVTDENGETSVVVIIPETEIVTDENGETSVIYVETESEDTAEHTVSPETAVETEAETEPDLTGPWKGMVISKVYGNDGNIDGASRYSFIELYNTADTDICLDGLSLYYKTDNEKPYSTYSFPEGYTARSHSYLLIRCGEAGENGTEYNTEFEIFKVDKYDLEWNKKIDNREIRLILAPAGLEYDITREVALLSNKVSYFVASDTEYFDTGYVSGMSKNKVAVRTALTDYSGYYVVNLQKANSSKLNQITPTASTGSNQVVKSLLNEVYFSEPAGFYDKEIKLTLSAPEGYTIYYTTNGSTPTKSSSKYTDAITLADSTNKGYNGMTKYVANQLGNRYIPASNDIIGGYVIKAFASNGTDTTPVYTNSYFVSSKMADYGVSVISVSMNRTEFCGTDGFYNNYYSGANGTNTRGLGLVEVFGADGQRYGYSNVEFAISGHGSSGWAMKSMRLYYKKSNNEEGGLESDLHYDLFGGYSTNVKGQAITDFSRILLRNSGNDCSESYIRDAYMQRVSSSLNVDTMASASVLVFINGEFWGVYNARERYSGEYVESHYGIDKDNVALIESDYSQVHTNTNADFVLSSGIEGDEKDFNDLLAFIRENDLTNADNYRYVESKLDLDSFIDMYVARLYFNARDWPENNIKIWRDRTAEAGTEFGKWHFTLLDMDMGISYFPNENNTTENANFFGWCDTTGCVIGTISHKLLKNAEYKSKFLSRFYEVVNEVYVPDTLYDALTEMVDERAEIFQLQVDRWGNSDGASWKKYNTSIDNMKRFVKNRNSYAIKMLCGYFGVSETDLANMGGSYISVFFNAGRTDVSINGENVINLQSIKFEEKLIVNVKAAAKEGYYVSSIQFTSLDGEIKTVEGDSATFEVTKSGTVMVTVKKISTGESEIKIQSGITASAYSMFYLNEKGELYGWGNNPLNMLGISGGASNVLVPTFVTDGVAKVETGHSCDSEQGNNNVTTAILTVDGEVYTVGNNSNGQLGRDGDPETLGKISFTGKIVDVSVGYDHLLILDEDGTLWGVGNNSYGQLGERNNGNSTHDFQVVAYGVASISAGRRNSAYIDDKGDCYILGDARWNKFAESTDNITKPLKILSNVKYISSGEHEMIFVTRDGKLYYSGWRSINGFQNGSGTAGPKLLMSSGVETAEIHFANMIIMTADGKAYAYGLNTGNAIGNEYTDGNPGKIVNSGVVDVAAGYSFVAYQTEDGSIYVTGDNSCGQAGKGTCSDYVNKSKISIK